MEQDYENENSMENTLEASPLGDKLNQILSDPDSMARLMQTANALAGTGLLDGLGGLMGGGSPSHETETSKETAAKSTENDPAGESKEHREQKPKQNHTYSKKHATLLSALKPYLGNERRDRIDRMLKLLQLAELAESVLHTESAKKNDDRH